jgi:hypothetical protein
MIAGRRPWFVGHAGLDGAEAREVVLPVQPERMLMVAILGDAVRSYRRPAWARSPEDRAEFADVREWVHSTAPGSLYSFQNICDTLGLDSSRLRRGFRRWLEDSRPARRRGQRPRRRPPAPRRASATH